MYKRQVWDGKPDCPLIGANGNIFNLMGIAARTLAENDRNDEAKEMCGRVIQCGSYDAALGVIGEYVNIVSVEERNEPELNGMEY